MYSIEIKGSKDDRLAYFSGQFSPSAALIYKAKEKMTEQEIALITDVIKAINNAYPEHPITTLTGAYNT
jgi:hypothetical protein